MKVVNISSKGEKLNWKPLKEVTPVKIAVSKLKGQKVTAGRSPKNQSKILIP